MSPAAACSASAAAPPLVSARVIAFAVDNDGLKVALLRRGAALALPRAELRPGETLTNCAERVAVHAFAAQPDYLEQLYTFSSAAPDAEVSVAYFALLSAETRAAVQRKPSVAFMHVDGALSPNITDDATDASERAMLRYATTRLRAKLGYSNIAFYFMPREFSLSELQDVYEMTLGRQLDKRNFRRRILAAGIVEAVGVRRSAVNHRPATLYRFAGGDPATGALTPVETEWRS